MAPEPSDFLANAEASPLSPLHGLIRHAWTLLLPLAGVVPLGLSYLAQSKVPPPSDTETVETEAVLEEQQVAETSPTSLPPEDIIEESNLPSPEPASKLRITAIPPENLLPSAGIPVQYHDVRPGDTLSEIAEAHGVSVAELVAWNSLDDP
ncbi:MAG: LysM peptidoglycan-binding domain-containing protein, partial [Verrucomicrobiota bacterium]